MFAGASRPHAAPGAADPYDADPRRRGHPRPAGPPAPRTGTRHAAAVMARQGAALRRGDRRPARTASTPGDPGWDDPSPQSAESPGDSPFNSPPPSPPPAPAPASAASMDSPTPPPPAQVSADSPPRPCRPIRRSPLPQTTEARRLAAPRRAQPGPPRPAGLRRVPGGTTAGQAALGSLGPAGLSGASCRPRSASGVW